MEERSSLLQAIPQASYKTVSLRLTLTQPITAANGETQVAQKLVDLLRFGVIAVSTRIPLVP